MCCIEIQLESEMTAKLLLKKSLKVQVYVCKLIGDTLVFNFATFLNNVWI